MPAELRVMNGVIHFFWKGPDFCVSFFKQQMETFKISFWNLPVSKDDSFIGLPQAELIHASVNARAEGQSRHYTVEPLNEEWKQQAGIIELTCTADHHWNVERGNEIVEGIFPRIVQAIEDVESAADDQPEVE